MTVKRSRPIVVRQAPGNPRQARVQVGHAVVRASLGAGGLRALKREGDGGTPIGRFPVREVLFRSDRMKHPPTRATLRAIRDTDAWSDDPSDPNYNRLVTLPKTRRAEGLFRDDHLYDIVIVLGYNDRRRIKGRGSAIFMHLAREGYTPTEGCVGLSRRDLLRVLALLKPDTHILILP